MKRADPEFSPHVLREYSFIADGERGALIGPRGEIAWMCFPYWDSDAVFAPLIGGAGTYAVTPVSRFVWGGYYERRSLIWRSRWVTEDGVIECREALAFPAQPERATLLRRIVAVHGDARVHVKLEPRSGYGQKPMIELASESGIWTGRSGDIRFRWQGGARARRRGRGPLELDLTVPAGTHHDLVLELGKGSLPDDCLDAGMAWEATEAGWEGAVPDIRPALAPDDVGLSYAILRGLTSRGGGMVAAATTSLPERAEAGRNYDYRYVWIRDQCYAAHGAAAVGDDRLVADAAGFVASRLLEHGKDLAPAYTTRGGPVPDQRELGLPGYPGGSDRVGNWVNRQFQLDGFGESLLLFAQAARRGLLDSDGWQAALVAADAVTDRWQEPDAGIWEIEPRPWTHSRLMVAAGLRAMAAASPPGPGPRDWMALADHIVADTAAHALHPEGYWIRAPGDERLDGALLIPPLRGAVPAADPRTRATLSAYIRELTEQGYAYRFRHGAGPLGQAEGSFILCGFLLAMALHQQGEQLEAFRWWERTKAACGPPMLYSEEYDVGERQMRGNLPQAFVHALMLEASARLVE